MLDRISNRAELVGEFWDNHPFWKVIDIIAFWLSFLLFFVALSKSSSHDPYDGWLWWIINFVAVETMFFTAILYYQGLVVALFYSLGLVALMFCFGTWWITNYSIEELNWLYMPGWVLDNRQTLFWLGLPLLLVNVGSGAIADRIITTTIYKLFKKAYDGK